ncbi:MAG: glycosyltransferase, partial [Beijerinckiaceae bacterium]
RSLIQVSRAHAYLTYPFVLSWSMLESLAAECLVVGSATPPVQEVLRHGENGLLVDFFDIDGWVSTLTSVLGDPDAYRPLSLTARADILKTYDLHSVCLPRQLRLIKALAAKASPEALAQI